MTQERDGMAIANLQIMAAAGELRIPEPWTNELGNTCVAWREDHDGDVLACYLDMLGLNGRATRKPRGWRARAAVRQLGPQMAAESR